MKIITQLRKIHHLKIIAKKTAGLVLTGNEIKSVRNQQISISDAYVLSQRQELYLYNSYISSYRYAGSFSLSQQSSNKKPRKLLLRKGEIKNLIHQLKIKHYALVPLQIFINEKGWAKVEIALVQNLKKFQVKNQAKEKEIKKKLQRKEYD